MLLPLPRRVAAYLSHYSVPALGTLHPPAAGSVLLALEQSSKLWGLYLGGPHPQSTVLVPTQPWPALLEPLRTTALQEHVYPVCHYWAGEGATVWFLRTDTDLWLDAAPYHTPDFLAAVETPLQRRQPAVAYDAAAALLPTRQVPYVLGGVCSLQLHESCPCYGHARWHCALQDGVLSLTQVPSLLLNTEHTATWHYHSPRLSTVAELHATYGRGGDTASPAAFLRLRQYCLEDCTPAAPPHAPYTNSDPSSPSTHGPLW